MSDKKEVAWENAHKIRGKNSELYEKMIMEM